jgi:hypothetical protein
VNRIAPTIKQSIYVAYPRCFATKVSIRESYFLRLSSSSFLYFAGDNKEVEFRALVNLHESRQPSCTFLIALLHAGPTCAARLLLPRLM